LVEKRPWLFFLRHAVLIAGVLLVLFPVWVALVASTHEAVR
jgi:sn-glycerol 3-phosphate transport system permease protein